MPTLICNKRSTTLFEIIVATVIFSLVMAGVVGVFVAGKRQVMHSRDRMTSSEMGKLFLDPLQLDVRQDFWVSGALDWGPHSYGVSQIVNTIPYTAQYDVTPVPGTDLRRVVATISWTEN